MTFRVNRKLFDWVKVAIAETMRVDTRHWGMIEGCEAITSVSEIRALALSSNCGTVACIGGWACFLATEDEIVCAIKAYGLSDPDANEPLTLASALLRSGANHIEALEKTCLPLFSSDWPYLEQVAYDDCRIAEEGSVGASADGLWGTAIERASIGGGRDE